MAAGNEGRWRVGELASATGLTVRALHHYDRLGLLEPAERTTSGHRLYAEGDVRRLYRIVALRHLGLRLDEIASVLDDGEPGLAEIVRRHLGRVERELERQLRLRDRLVGLVEALERSLEPSVDQFIDAMEAMTMLADVAEIARILGVSRPRATKLAGSAPDFPPSSHGERVGRPVWARRQVETWGATHPDRGPAWQRPSSSGADGLTASMRTITGLAWEQSRELDHGWIGDEHLLLALLHPDCPGAAREALETCGLTFEVVRRAVIESVGDSSDTASNGALLSRSTQSVLQRAGLKAVELRDETVSGEHVLLALLDAREDSRALALLAEGEIHPAEVAQHAIALTDRGPAGSDRIDDAPPLSGRIHAAEVARILGVGRRRVAQLAVSAPDFPRSEMTAHGYRVWSRSGVESWGLAHPDRGPALRRLKPPVPGDVGRGTERILEIAKAEAKKLNHTWVGRDHLFLALLNPNCPGEAGAVLEALGLQLEEVRGSYVESMGDPYEPHDREPVIPPGTYRVLEQATLTALELEDEEVTGGHVLVALTQDWEEGSLQFSAVLPEVQAAALHERLMAETDGMMPASEPSRPRPHPWESSVRVPHPAEPELSPSPAGHDPRRRKPWGSAVFDIPGKPWSPVNGQYRIDRDGYAVLTSEGQPVSSLTDEEGRDVLDEDGNGILKAVAIPDGSEVRHWERS